MEVSVLRPSRCILKNIEKWN